MGGGVEGAVVLAVEGFRNLYCNLVGCVFICTLVARFLVCFFRPSTAVLSGMVNMFRLTVRLGNGAKPQQTVPQAFCVLFHFSSRFIYST